MDEGYDYFTKLYVIEEEFLFEIQGLSVVNVQEVIPDSVISNEIPVRTESNGWKWRDIDRNHIPEEWMQMAIQATYIIGFLMLKPS